MTNLEAQLDLPKLSRSVVYRLAVQMSIIGDSNIYNLADAAQAVVDRWDCPSWKESEHTAVFINKLRDELKKFKEEDKL